jgi:hypothetical protein
MTSTTKVDPTAKKLSLAAISAGKADIVIIDAKLKSEVQKSEVDAFAKLAKDTLARNKSVTLILIKH